MNKEEKESTIYVILLVLWAMFVSFSAGQKYRQEAHESRAKNLNKKDCYSWQDIETILFNEIQE